MSLPLPANLLCRNGCGFYGNPEWQWFCSKCWREHLRSKQTLSPNRGLPSSVAGPSPAFKGAEHAGALEASSVRKSLSKPSDERKKHISLDKNLKQIFQGRSFGTNKESPEKSARFGSYSKISSFSSSSSTASSAPCTPSRSYRSHLPVEAKAVSHEFALFLNQRLERAAVSDVSNQVKNIVDKILQTAHSLSTLPSANQSHIDDLSAVVQEFCLSFRRRLDTKQIYTVLSEEDKRKIMDYAEKYMMICCYKKLFCPVLTNDEDKDLEIQNRIRNLSWISTHDLKCPLNESSQQVRDLLYEAINDILEVDGKMAPQDKLDCIVKCSKKIFDMLKLSNEDPASADDFLPCLIYICLKANPPRIQSNINFITRFCNENKLRMGEGGYFFANLCCAVSFIENMSAESVNMNVDEFDSYVSGRSAPPGSWRSSLLLCEGLQLMSQNARAVADLQTRQDKMMQEAVRLQQEMRQFEVDIQKEVSDVLARTQYVLVGPKRPVNVDAKLNDEAAKSLPPPLIPLSASAATCGQDAASTQPQDESEASLIPTACSSLLIEQSAATDSDIKLEDFLSISSSTACDNVSLLSVDGTIIEDDQTPVAAAAYHGFTAQSSSILSIACDTARSAMETSKLEMEDGPGSGGLSESKSDPMVLES